jgi:hypothetical protein
MGDASILADFALLRSRYRHASPFVLMRVRKDLFVAERDRRADIER